MSRKRSHDRNDPGYASKRTYMNDERSSSTGTSDYLFKLLCPAYAAGSVIGKGGAVINEITHITGAKIRVSQSTEIYPGTEDRIIVIAGEKNCIFSAIKELLYRILEDIERKKGNNDNLNSNSSKKDLEMRCLIPSTAAGLIIGVGGEIIREMGVKHACKLQLATDLSSNIDTKERILTIRGFNVNNVTEATQSACAQMLSDSILGDYAIKGTNYDKLFPKSTDSQHRNQYFPQSQQSYAPYQQQSSQFNNSYEAANLPYRDEPSHNYPPRIPQVQTHSVLSPSQYQSNQYAPQQFPQSLPSQQNQPLQSNDRISTPQFSTDGTNIIMHLGIPDALVGSLIGKGGSILKDIMSQSNTSAHVSAKGDFLHNTTQRYIKVIGSQEQVQDAVLIILDRLSRASEEQNSKRQPF